MRFCVVWNSVVRFEVIAKKISSLTSPGLDPDAIKLS